jgi:hypothetical protein
MPTLDLTPEMIGPERSRLVLSYIATVMLYPDDEQKRKRAMDASVAANILVELPDAMGDQDALVLLGPTDLPAMLRILANAPPLSEVQEETKPRIVHGAVAAMILLDALEDRHVGRQRGLRWVKEKIRKKLLGQVHFERLSMSTIENRIWRVYRPVAALWAAHSLLAAEYRQAGIKYAHPCHVDDVSRFLGLAEALRRDAEGYKLKQYDGTLLDPKTSWAVPPGIDLPGMELPWPRRPEAF